MGPTSARAHALQKLQRETQSTPLGPRATTSFTIVHFISSAVLFTFYFMHIKGKLQGAQQWVLVEPSLIHFSDECGQAGTAHRQSTQKNLPAHTYSGAKERRGSHWVAFLLLSLFKQLNEVTYI